MGDADQSPIQEASMSADVMSVRLHLRGVRVTEVSVDTPEGLAVPVPTG